MWRRGASRGSTMRRASDHCRAQSPSGRLGGRYRCQCYTKAACSRWSSAKPNWPKSSSCTRATAHATQKAAVRRHPRLLPEGDRLPRQPRQSDERSPAQRRFEYGTDPAHVVECNQRARGSDSGSALRRPFCCAKSGKHMTCWRARALLNARAAQRAAELPSRKEYRHVQI
jgi:hypothetical protein